MLIILDYLNDLAAFYILWTFFYKMSSVVKIKFNRCLGSKVFWKLTQGWHEIFFFFHWSHLDWPFVLVLQNVDNKYYGFIWIKLIFLKKLVHWGISNWLQQQRWNRRWVKLQFGVWRIAGVEASYTSGKSLLLKRNVGLFNDIISVQCPFSGGGLGGVNITELINLARTVLNVLNQGGQDNGRYRNF